ncbi:hypothetical protein [Caminibacter pacificus]|uniref:Uncharacterized protein n=1 Tax=Caminibacter pacificus TaxID=1424653 RepID=A0AAJ4UWY6_9BACT|nr:hypothetical protein [Caminibacter pacificus]QDD68215.1 hypothetical protein C6V80_10190 [Caminibacter pacificus]ROR38729.1 hypothetical protein EDC58_1944 [Caminibacter pacificus]
MKKQTKKELALLFAAYVFINRGLEIAEVKEEDVKIMDEYSLKVINIFQKLKKLSPTFHNRELVFYYYKRLYLLEDKPVNIAPLVLGLFLLRTYLELREETKYINVASKKEVERIIREVSKDYEIKPEDVRLAYEFATAFLPEKAGLIEFKKITKRLFGIEFIKNLNFTIEMIEKYKKGLKITQEAILKAKKATEEFFNPMSCINIF